MPAWAAATPAAASAPAALAEEPEAAAEGEAEHDLGRDSALDASHYAGLSSFALRARLKEAVCRIDVAGRTGMRGSGFLVEYGGLQGVLTVNSLVPDRDTARTSSATFHTAHGERVCVALLPETLFLSSPARAKDVALDYTLVACEDCGPLIRPLVVRRSQQPAVAAGDAVHILLRDETDNSARSECRVVRVRSLFHFHCALDAQDVETATGLTGTLIQIIQTLWCAGHLTAVKIDTTVRERPLGTRRQHI